MKINICTGPNFPVPPLQGGGMARVWHGLAHLFADNDHEVTITARSHPQQPEHSQEGNVSITRFGGFNQSGSLAINLCKDLCYAASVSARLSEADITVINDFWLPALAPRFSQSPGKLIVSVNRMPKGQYSLYRKCNAFVCPNQQVANRLRKQNPELEEKISIIPNPYDSTAFTTSYHERRGILYVGRVHPEKGLHLLIEALPAVLTEHPDTTLTVIGSAEEAHGGGGAAYSRDLQSRSEQLPVHWHGPEYQTEKLRAAYQSHQVFVYPSLSENGETFGIAPVEAMACGCVPITSQLAVFSNFIQPDNNGYWFAHQHQDAASQLAQAITRALNNTSTLARLSNHAVETAREYSMPCIGNRFLELFHNLSRQT